MTMPEPMPIGGKSERSAPDTVIDDEVVVTEAKVKLKPHKRLDGTPYEIIRWLGDGGMGVVFEARHVDLDRSVALKVLRSTERESLVKLFRGEAKALARLGSD